MSLSSVRSVSYIARIVSLVLENVTRDTDAWRKERDSRTRVAHAFPLAARKSLRLMRASRSVPAPRAFYSGNCKTTLSPCHRALSHVITRDIRARARRDIIKVYRAYLHVNTYRMSRKLRPIKFDDIIIVSFKIISTSCKTNISQFEMYTRIIFLSITIILVIIEKKIDRNQLVILSKH